ncbi:2,3-bisphosphoglycerate-dependent phosphoglycerate mutase [mine drainage metagenome]|uniref:2,3-bisphosphoglycerate-dependent phosphoglycerate mutase n=1 Tax=mine drainage metagenome TaxID=410659 RepID=A0A1J5QDM5_9ZZZZ
MAIKIVYFPHGTTTDNDRGISSGWLDVELSQRGVEQSTELRELIKDRTFDAVFCSDLKSAVDSANLAFEGVPPILTDARLRECNYGQFNGRSSQVVDEMHEVAPTRRFPDGESYEDVKARVSDFLDFLRKHFEGKDVAVVGHKATQLCLDVLLKGRTWEEAFAEDWRKTKAWQPGWDYILD